MRDKQDVKVSSRIPPLAGYDRETPHEPVFGAKLVPLSKGPISFPQPSTLGLDTNRKALLSDVSPGTYRLLVYDWLGTRRFPWDLLDSGEPQNEPLFDRHVVVVPGGRDEVRITLGAGCITGRIAPPSRVFLSPPVGVIAVPNSGRRYARWACCDFDGTFCIRYLTPGKHSLYIHDPSSGFCRIDQVEVPAGLVDVGEQRLKTGATVIATVQYPRQSRVPDELVAVGRIWRLGAPAVFARLKL